MKDFVTNAVIKSIEEYEAQLDSRLYQAITQERDNAIPLDQPEKDIVYL